MGVIEFAVWIDLREGYYFVSPSVVAYMDMLYLIHQS